MFVIVDIEWVTNHKNHTAPTQLAGIKIDDNWKTAASFFRRIRPFDNSYYQWKHVAYNGGSSGDFFNAESAYSVLRAFSDWLGEDDVLLWWQEEPQRQYQNYTKYILKQEDGHKSIILKPYAAYHLNARGISDKHSVYKLLKEMQLPIPPVEHNSRNDTIALRTLLEELSVTREELFQPPLKAENAETAVGGSPEQSENASDDKKRKDEQRQKRILKNTNTFSRSHCAFGYAAGSSVFHSANCRYILSAKTICTVGKFATLIGHGLTPCKCCKPTPENELHLPDTKKKIPDNKRGNVEGQPTINKEMRKALKRQSEAKKNRERLLEKAENTTEREDAYTLTQPRFAFFAAAGYATFHLPDCHKLQKLSSLKGFAFYDEAKRAGLKPCRYCKPSSKNNMELSVPFFSSKKQGETGEDLYLLCEEAGFSTVFSSDNRTMEIHTPVGLWQVELYREPITLKHINLVRTPGNTTVFHTQPRIFLSFSDVFEYIRRHDESLTEKNNKMISSAVNCDSFV